MWRGTKNLGGHCPRMHPHGYGPAWIGGCYGFTKIDMANITDTYNKVRFGRKGRQRLALSTHRRVLLQNALSFGISFAPGYFQQLLDETTSDLPGVAVYLDDILCSGPIPEAPVQNLRRLFERLRDKGLRCRLEKCSIALPQAAYLGHVLSRRFPRSKGQCPNDVPAPHDVSTLRSFLESLQFYAKFLPHNYSTVAETLYRLTRKDRLWAWGSKGEVAFHRFKKFCL